VHKPSMAHPLRLFKAARSIIHFNRHKPGHIESSIWENRNSLDAVPERDDIDFLIHPISHVFSSFEYWRALKNTEATNSINKP